MKLIFMRIRSVVALLAIAVLISLGTATQYADAFSSNGAVDSNDIIFNNGSLYGEGDIYVIFTFDGDRTSGNSNDWAADIRHGARPNDSDIVVTNPNSNARVASSTQDYSSSSVFSFTFKLENLDDGATTVTFPAGTIGPASSASNRNAAITYSFIYDDTNPTFAAGADFSTVRLTVNDPSPPYLKVECVDQYRSNEFAYSTKKFDNVRDYDDPIIINTDAPGEIRISYSCTDTSGNRIDGAKLYRVYSTAVPAVPTYISIASDNDDPTKAKSGDIVTITFDTEAGSTVTGTIDGEDATGNVAGTTGTLKLTLDGMETEGLLAFSFVQSNSNGSTETQTAVRGSGAKTSVTADFTAPVFATSTDATDVAVGDTIPTLLTLCTDANAITVTNDADIAAFNGVGAKTVIYTCTDAAGNTATQSVSYRVPPTIFNERVSSPTSKTEVDGIIYHNSNPRLYFSFDGGDGRDTSSPTLSITNGLASNRGTFGNGTNSFYHEYAIFPFENYGITVTVTYPANSFTINGVSNDAVTYTYVSDKRNPTFQSDADFSTVELTVGDESPTLPTLQCRDTHILTPSALRSGSVNANLAGDYPVEYTCKDKAGNSVTETKTYRVLGEIPAVPANISIASDNARDTSLAKSGDIVTITFDTQAGSTVTGTIDGKDATFAFNGTSSTLTRTLNGTETEGSLIFSFVQSRYDM